MATKKTKSHLIERAKTLNIRIIHSTLESPYHNSSLYLENIHSRHNKYDTMHNMAFIPQTQLWLSVNEASWSHSKNNCTYRYLFINFEQQIATNCTYASLIKLRQFATVFNRVLHIQHTFCWSPFHHAPMSVPCQTYLILCTNVIMTWIKFHMVYWIWNPRQWTAFC